MGVREQVRDLDLQRTGVDDLAQRRVGSQRQQVARDVEGAGLQRALVLLLLHVGGLGGDADEVLRHVRRERVIFCKKTIQRLAVEIAGFVVGPKVGGVVAALLEILIAGGALLAVPALLVGQFDGG